METERMKMRVLFITPWYPHPNSPSEGVFVRDHAQAVRLHDDVVVLHCQMHLGGKSRSWPRFERDEDENRTLGIPTYRMHYRPVFRSGTAYGLPLFFGMYRAVRRLIRMYGRPDVIHVHVYVCVLPALILARLFGARLVVTEHCTAFPRRILPRIEAMKARFAFPRADLVVPVSRALQEAIEWYGVRARYRVIPNPVNTGLFAIDPPEVRPAGPIRLLFVGSLVRRKGVEHLLQALATLKDHPRDWVLDLVGSDPGEFDHQGLAADLGIAEKVLFHGEKKHDEVAGFMSRADLVVVPSLCETFSVVTVEALACGVPVVVTRCGGPEQFVTEHVGRIVPPSDPAALALAIGAMFDHLEEYDRRAIASYGRSKFGMSVVGDMLHDAYTMVTGRAAAPNPNAVAISLKRTSL